MIYDLWFMIYDLWFMIYDLWFMIYDLWFMIYIWRESVIIIKIRFIILYFNIND